MWWFLFILLFCWLILKPMEDAIRFGKSEPCHEVWHIIKWFAFWSVAIYTIIKYEYYKDIKFVAILIVCSFGFNFMYGVFRLFNVYKLDNKLRIKWLGKILGRSGII